MANITQQITVQVGKLDDTKRGFLTDSITDVELTAFLVPSTPGLVINPAVNDKGEPIRCESCSDMIAGCKGWGYWNITHLATMRAVNRHRIGMFCEAIEFARILAATGLDWSRAVEEQGDDPKVREAVSIIYRYDDQILAMLAPCPQQVISDYCTALGLRERGLLDDEDLRTMGWLGPAEHNEFSEVK